MFLMHDSALPLAVCFNTYAYHVCGSSYVLKPRTTCVTYYVFFIYLFIQVFTKKERPDVPDIFSPAHTPYMYSVVACEQECLSHLINIFRMPCVPTSRLLILQLHFALFLVEQIFYNIPCLFAHSFAICQRKLLHLSWPCFEW